MSSSTPGGARDLEVTAAGVDERGRRALLADADIRDFSEELAERTMADLGRLDVWVNNVGGSDEKTVRELVDTPDEIWRAQLELNLTSAFQGAKAAAGRMEPGGVIVNIASGAGTRGSPRTGPYAAAKAGMLNLTQTLALELAPRGIRVNAVSPGPVATEAFLEVLGVSDRTRASCRRRSRSAASARPTTSPPPSSSWPLRPPTG